MKKGGEHILIVEDSEFNARLLSLAVAELAAVTVVVSGEEALAAMAERDFDVVLLDIMLPDIDGFEVCRRIIEDKGTAAPAIMFVTSLDDSEDEERGLSLGAVDYIYKPIAGPIVRARVNNHLMLSRARRDLLAANEELTRLATIDPLTGIYNRRHFFDLMEREQARAERYQQDYSLMGLDLDHFKSINDTYGHERGDAVLIAVTKAWTRTLRTHDILGRVGGEEFLMFLPQTNGEQAVMAAGRILEATRALEIEDGKGGKFGITASIGIAVPDERCTQSLTICADKALYRAKEDGRDRAVSLSWDTCCGAAAGD